MYIFFIGKPNLSAHVTSSPSKLYRHIENTERLASNFAENLLSSNMKKDKCKRDREEGSSSIGMEIFPKRITIIAEFITFAHPNLKIILCISRFTQGKKISDKEIKY